MFRLLWAMAWERGRKSQTSRSSMRWGEDVETDCVEIIEVFKVSNKISDIVFVGYSKKGFGPGIRLDSPRVSETLANLFRGCRSRVSDVPIFAPFAAIASYWPLVGVDSSFQTLPLNWLFGQPGSFYTYRHYYYWGLGTGSVYVVLVLLGSPSTLWPYSLWNRTRWR